VNAQNKIQRQLDATKEMQTNTEVKIAGLKEEYVILIQAMGYD